MRIYLMDRDYEVMKKLESFISSDPQNQVKCFTNHQDLVDEIRRVAPDAVLIDFDLQSSLTAVKAIKNSCPEAKIVIMSADRNKALEGFELSLSGFLLKPVEEEELKKQLFGIRHPLLARVKGYGKGTV